VIGLLCMRITRRSMIVTRMGRDLREGKRALVHSKLCLLLQRIQSRCGARIPLDIRNLGRRMHGLS
jgi:hypothetical protein